METLLKAAQVALDQRSSTATCQPRWEAEGLWQALVNRRAVSMPILLFSFMLMAQLYLCSLRSIHGWEDEVFFASTSCNLLQHSPNAHGIFNTVPAVRFYGPLNFVVGAAVFKTFGFSLAVWRTYSFAGEFAFLAATCLLLKTVGCSRLGCALGALIATLSLEFSFAVLHPGRPDFWTVSLLITILALSILVLSGHRRNKLATATVIGLLIAAALASTPRAIPFIASTAAAVLLVALLKRDVNSLPVVEFTVASAVAASTFWAMLKPFGLNPISWFNGVYRGTHGDYICASPLLGGRWEQLGHHRYEVLFALCILVSLLTSTFLLKYQKRRINTTLLVALIACTINALLTTVLLGNGFVSYVSAYWILPLALLAFALVEHVAHGPIPFYACLILIATWGTVVGQDTVFRVSRMEPIVQAWNRSNPALIDRFVEANVPSASVVFGPVGWYFFPVQRHGSEYRYLVERTTPGLGIRGDIGRPEELQATVCSRPAYLLWPSADADGFTPIPENALKYVKSPPVAVFQTDSLAPLSQPSNHKSPRAGEPKADLYLLQCTPPSVG